MTHNKEKGAALLIAVLILTAILVSFALVGSKGELNQLTVTTTGVNKKRADALASACMEHALYDLATNGSYAGNEIISIGPNTCQIRPVLGSSPWTIESQATFQGITSRLRVIVTSRTPIVTASWERPSSW